MTEDDVLPRVSEERRSISTIKGVDDLAATVQSVTEQVRHAYISGGRYVGDEGTIPAGLRSRAIALALWQFLTTGVAANERIHTVERRKAAEEAQSYLDKIASREIQGSGSARIVTGSKRVATRDHLNGL